MKPTLSAEVLLRGWSPQRVGRHVVTLAECNSTNDAVLDRASVKSVDGVAFFTDHQSAGRGRQGRVWVSPRAASILCSVGVEEAFASLTPSQGGDSSAARAVDRPPVEQEISGRLTLTGAVAACEAIRQATDIVPSIKWPNDLRVAGRKLAGILIESRSVPARGTRAWVIGIGINCLQHAAHFPPELRDQVTSLEIESREPVDRAELARALLQRLDAWIADPSSELLALLHERWLEFAEPLGERVQLMSGGREYRGRILSVDPTGGLIVQCDDGRPAWFDPMQTKLL